MNWILANLSAAVDFFSGWMTKVYDVLMINPVTYQDGKIWHVADKIYDAVLGPAVSIMVILFLLSLSMDAGEYIRTKRVNHIVLTFAGMFFMSGILVGGKYILILIFWVIREIIDAATGTNGSNFISLSWIEIPEQVVKATDGMNVRTGIMFWVVTLIVALLVMVSGFVVLLVVFGRLFKIYLHVAVAPLALSTILSRQTRMTFVAFIRSFIGVCVEGFVIVCVCMIFSAFADNFQVPVTDSYSYLELTEEEIAQMTEEEKQQVLDGVWAQINGKDDSTRAYIVWCYLGQMVFLYLMMVGSIKGADNWVHQKLNL